jgi:hypothetical protein
MEATEQPEGRKFPVYLIDMNGRVVHTWVVTFTPLQARLLSNGNIVVSGLTVNQEIGFPAIRMRTSMGGYTDNLVELTWEGKQVFAHTDLNMHHDFAKLPNGNYLYLAWEPLPKDLREKVRGGFKNSEHLFGMPQGMRQEYMAGKVQRGVDFLRMFGDYLVEVNPKGQVVWQWHAKDHLDPDTDIIGPLYRREEWLHANSIGVLRNGNIVLTCRNTDSILMIDKRTGRIISRWGNVASLDKVSGQLVYRAPKVGVRPGDMDETLGGPHDAQEIPVGYPGAGHLTIYNNAIYGNASRALELDLATRRVVWQSRAPGLGRTPYSAFLGSAQRLPNGNTLICEGLNGRFFQVTMDDKVVWEYVNPYDGSPAFRGAVYRVNAYPPEYCPQFKKLPPAAGSAVKAPPMIPADQVKAVESAAEQAAHRESLTRMTMLIALLGSTAAVSLLVGRWLGRRSQ